MANSRSSERYRLLLNLLLFIIFLYLFFVSIELIGKAFKGFGGGFAKELIATTSNPFVGLFIGVLATTLAQSSSLTTSVLVGMVAAGTINVQNAIPVLMGANIGTTVTNTIVAMAHITRKQEFRKAFSGAVVHDFFNLLSVIIILPLHLLTQLIFGRGFLEIAARGMASIFTGVGGTKFASPLKMVTKPVITILNGKLFPGIAGLFAGPDNVKLVASIITLVFALGLLFLALKYMTKFMRSAIAVKMENLFDSYLFKTAIRSFALGAILTSIVQSSSVTTSLSVPLIAAGLLTIEQVYPYVLGANLGTTITAMLASLALGSPVAITVAFAHLCFNISGTIIWYPLRKLPIAMALKMADICTRSRKLALGYLVVVFYIIPGLLILIAR